MNIIKNKLKSACLDEMSRIYIEMVKTKREQQRAKQEEIASLLEIQQATYSKLERGKGKLELSDFLIIKKYLGISEKLYWSFHEDTYFYLQQLEELYLNIHFAKNSNEILNLISRFNEITNCKMIKSNWLILANIHSYFCERLKDEEGVLMMEYVYAIAIVTLIIILISETFNLSCFMQGIGFAKW